jgi:hypothetical protein
LATAVAIRANAASCLSVSPLSNADASRNASAYAMHQIMSHDRARDTLHTPKKINEKLIKQHADWVEHTKKINSKNKPLLWKPKATRNYPTYGVWIKPRGAAKASRKSGFNARMRAEVATREVLRTVDASASMAKSATTFFMMGVSKRTLPNALRCDVWCTTSDTHRRMSPAEACVRPASKRPHWSVAPL